MKSIYGKIVYEDQWVRLGNMLRNKFYSGCRQCSVCGGVRVEAVWYNFTTDEVRCERCFIPKGAKPQGKLVKKQMRGRDEQPLAS